MFPVTGVPFACPLLPASCNLCQYQEAPPKSWGPRQAGRAPPPPACSFRSIWLCLPIVWHLWGQCQRLGDESGVRPCVQFLKASAPTCSEFLRYLSPSLLIEHLAYDAWSFRFISWPHIISLQLASKLLEKQAGCTQCCGESRNSQCIDKKKA